MAPTTISSYETGKIQPPPDKLIYLADCLNVTTDYLLGRSKYDIDPSVFNRTICGTKTLGNLVDDLMALSPKQKEAAMILISDMRFRADYNARAKLQRRRLRHYSDLILNSTASQSVSIHGGLLHFLFVKRLYD